MEEKIKLTMNELFSGIGCQRCGFENSGLFDIEVVNTSEISKEAVLSYAAVHCGMTNEMVQNYTGYPSREGMAQYLTDINLGYEPDKKKEFDWFKLVKRKNKDLEKYWLACKLSNNLGDISRIEELPYADFWTVSFPCTDISISGKMAGLDPGSGTRSSLLWENIRLLKKAKDNNTLPKYLMVENVKNLVSKKFIRHFIELLDIFDNLGFNPYWSVINGKDCGVPQNRERVFVICIRKDIDTGKYTFPAPFDTGIRLKDVLEVEVDEKYYIPDEKVKKFLGNLKEEYSDKSANNPKFIGNIDNSGFGTGYHGGVWDKNCISPTLTTMQGGGRQPHILCDGQEPNIIKAGRLNMSQDGIVVSPDGIAPAHTAEHGNVPKILKIPSSSYCLDVNYHKGTTIEQYVKKKRRQLIFENTDGVSFIRIRKLTPRECWRLMGLTFEDCDKAADAGVANTHLYKQAGNGIITNCCELLAEHLYKAQYNGTYTCTDEKYTGNFTRPQAV